MASYLDLPRGVASGGAKFEKKGTPEKRLDGGTACGPKPVNY